MKTTRNGERRMDCGTWSSRLAKSSIVCLLAAAPSTAALAATPPESDSLRTARLQEVVVSSVRAKENGPFAQTTLRKGELQELARTGRELPTLIARTPGAMSWSDNGLGTGTSYLRIRGAADSRINVTIDGVPLNSPEDQCVFWANMNSYAALLGSVQIQRGVGTSTNGDGAFGGSIALATKAPSERFGGEANFGYGSYGTMNAGASLTSGLLFGHLIADAAYHATRTDGFLHGTSGRSGSYYGGLTWNDNKFSIRYKNIGNFEKTGQAWNGVAADWDGNSIMDGTYGEKTGIKTYKDMWNAGLGRFNTLYEHITGKDANGQYTTERYRLSNGELWSRTTDNFWQNHNILTGAWDGGGPWNATLSLHYTYGRGYYREFRPNNKLSKFGLTADGVKKADFIRKKGLSQNTYGAVGSATYKNQRWDIVGGFSLQQFKGNHFGYLTYSSSDAVNQKYLSTGEYQYYDSDARKTDGSVYLKATYSLTDALDLFGDVQYRHVDYKTDGRNDKFIEKSGNYANQMLDINAHYNFLNPKAGVSFNRDGHHAYASFAVANREPERNNFTDNGNYPAPRAERLYDTEAGYSFRNERLHVGANFYWMYYRNQFVKTGLKSDIGEDLTTNIKSSWRLGAELTAGVKVTNWMSVEGNVALSRNRISDFDEVVEDWDNEPTYTQTIHYDRSTLAFSPSCIANLIADFRWKGLKASLHAGHVSRQFLDNTANKDRSLPAYWTTDASLSYTLKAIARAIGMKEVVLALDCNNLLNSRYACSGWVYSAISAENGHTNDNRYYQIGYVPAAGFTAMGSITVRF